MTLWFHNQDRIDQLTEHYDRIDPETGQEFDIEPEEQEKENE